MGDNMFAQTALHFAALNGHVDIARLLTDRGISIDAQDVHGERPVYVAALKVLFFFSLFSSSSSSSSSFVPSSHAFNMHMPPPPSPPTHDIQGQVEMVGLLASRGADIWTADKVFMFSPPQKNYLPVPPHTRPSHPISLVVVCVFV
jgi:hypothetical protein